MIKKSFTILFIFILVAACGKKGDPVFKGKNYYKPILSTQKSTIS